MGCVVKKCKKKKKSHDENKNRKDHYFFVLSTNPVEDPKPTSLSESQCFSTFRPCLWHTATSHFVPTKDVNPFPRLLVMEGSPGQKVHCVCCWVQTKQFQPIYWGSSSSVRWDLSWETGAPRPLLHSSLQVSGQNRTCASPHCNKCMKLHTVECVLDRDSLITALTENTQCCVSDSEELGITCTRLLNNLLKTSAITVFSRTELHHIYKNYHYHISLRSVALSEVSTFSMIRLYSDFQL